MPTMVETETMKVGVIALSNSIRINVGREKELLARSAAAWRKPGDRFGDSLSTTVRKTAFFGCIVDLAAAPPRYRNII
jgi:hypothetical protein